MVMLCGGVDAPKWGWSAPLRSDTECGIWIVSSTSSRVDFDFSGITLTTAHLLYLFHGQIPGWLCCFRPFIFMCINHLSEHRFFNGTYRKQLSLVLWKTELFQGYDSALRCFKVSYRQHDADQLRKGKIWIEEVGMICSLLLLLVLLYFPLRKSLRLLQLSISYHNS